MFSGSIVAEFEVSGSTPDAVDASVQDIYVQSKNTTLSFDGKEVQPPNDMQVDNQTYSGGQVCDGVLDHHWG